MSANHRPVTTARGQVSVAVVPASPVYTADLWRSPIGWRFTVRRDEHLIGSSPWWLSPFFRSRAEALNAATRCAQNDKARRSVRLPV